MVAAGTYGCFEFAGLFASSLQRKQNDASTTDGRGTALVTLAQYCENSPRSTGMARNRRLTTNNLILLCTIYCKSVHGQIRMLLAHELEALVPVHHVLRI